MRGHSGMTVIVPADAVETEQAYSLQQLMKGLYIFAQVESGVPVLFDEEYRFADRKSCQLSVTVKTSR